MTPPLRWRQFESERIGAEGRHTPIKRQLKTFFALPFRVCHSTVRRSKLSGMKPAWIVVSAAVLGLLAQVSLQAQQAPREKIDLSKLGPQVGQQVPDFSLKDQYGETRTLNSIMGPRGAMLVFIRSADW
jgi:hypothetical protein